MFRVFNCLTTQHDWRLVVVAGLVCFLASLTAITLFNQARLKVGRARAIWIMAAGCAAGCGIWATHFLAMLAYDPGISIAYGIGLTALSLIAAASVTAAGLGIAAAYPTPGGAAAGGGIVGAGVACMHYLGMWALEVPGHVSWEPGLVALSIVLGMSLGMCALAAAVRWKGPRSVFAAAVLLTLAIVSHHFTAMGAVEIEPDPTRVRNALSLSPSLARHRRCQCRRRHSRHQPYQRVRGSPAGGQEPDAGDDTEQYDAGRRLVRCRGTSRDLQ